MSAKISYLIEQMNNSSFTSINEFILLMNQINRPSEPITAIFRPHSIDIKFLIKQKDFRSLENFSYAN